MTKSVEQQRETILRIAAKYGAHNVRVFGSAARDEATNCSDIDLLVDLDSTRSLLDQVGLQQELEEVLGRKIDVIVEGGISPYLEERILAEAVTL